MVIKVTIGSIFTIYLATIAFHFPTCHSSIIQDFKISMRYLMVITDYFYD